MKIGETACVCVEAGNPWNDSRIDVVPDHTYNFVVPNGETWTDWHIPCSTDGYPSTPLIRIWEGLRRVANQNWFKLIATVGRSVEFPIVVGSQLLDFCPAFSGRLYFFANDLRWMYLNNNGAVNMRVTQTN
jgi:hypothetical protein